MTGSKGGGRRLCLIGAIDDATSKVIRGSFVEAESSWGYFKMFSDTFRQHGLPHAVLRSVFQYGKMGERLAQIPAPLDDLIGRPVVINPQSLRSFIAVRGIAESDLGGTFSNPCRKRSGANSSTTS